jgi:diaphanous 1
LDLRRANNVGIGLSRFSKRLTDHEILECIVAGRGEKLSLDDLLTLQPLLPTPDEAAALGKTTTELAGRAEKFMSVMASEPMLPWMLEFLIFEQQFQNELEDITGKSTTMIEILTRLNQSTKIKMLLGTVLELGNLTNYEYGRKAAMLRRTGKALGFRLETLVKLAEVSSVDKKTTLLDYLVVLLAEHHPDILNLPFEFEDVRGARYWDMSAIISEYDVLKVKFKRLSSTNLSGSSSSAKDFYSRSQDFFTLASDCIQHADTLVTIQLPQTWKQTAIYFGEDPTSTKPEDIFGILDQFFRQLKVATEKYKAVSGDKSTPLGSASLTSSASDTVIFDNKK